MPEKTEQLVPGFFISLLYHEPEEIETYIHLKGEDAVIMCPHPTPALRLAHTKYPHDIRKHDLTTLSPCRFVCATGKKKTWKNFA